MNSAAGWARPLAAALAGLALAALWLIAGPALAASLAGDGIGAGVEALFTAAMFLPLLLLAIVGGAASGVRVLRAGRRPGRGALRGALLGVGGLLLATSYAALAGTLAGGAGTASAALMLGLLIVAVQVTAEEALFRGWLQPVLARAVGDWGAVVLGTAAFAGLHMLASRVGPLGFANMLLGGLLFSLLVLRDGGIAGAVAAHFMWNAGEQLALGLDPNPGVGGFGALLDLELAGGTIWGGGEQGLNGSLAMTIALVAVVAPLCLWDRKPTSSAT